MYNQCCEAERGKNKCNEKDKAMFSIFFKAEESKTKSGNAKKNKSKCKF